MTDHSWEEPGAFELCPGIFRIPLPLPNDTLRTVNVYVIVDTDSLVMVDAGWAYRRSISSLESALDSIGHNVGQVRSVVVTHMHRDHYTQASTIRSMSGAQVWLGADERESLEALIAVMEGVGKIRFAFSDRLSRAGALDLCREMDAVAPMAVSREKYELPDGWLSHDSVISVGETALRVIATPGHTRGHIALLDSRANLLFSGDHILPHITPSIGVERVSSPSPLADYLASLAVIRSLDDCMLLPAHGPVIPSAHARIDELLAHHEQRLAETMAAVEEGAGTAHAAALRLRWTRRGRRLEELSQFNQSLAILEMLAHLDLLVTRGALQSATDAEGVTHFAA